MSVRLILTDSIWKNINRILSQHKSRSGRPGLKERLFVEAVLYVARTGLPWRDLPRVFGNWQAVYRRFRRWQADGLWQKIWLQQQKTAINIEQYLFIDSSSIRAHHHAAGASKKKVAHKTKVSEEAEVDFRRKFTSAVSRKNMPSRWF